jgi:hypothetical protein
MIAQHARQDGTAFDAIAEKFQTEEWDTRDLKRAG